MKNESRRIKAGSGLIGLALALLWLAGCVSPDILQKDYGNSVQNNIAQSVLNPQAGLTDTPTVGLPPRPELVKWMHITRASPAEKAGTASTGAAGWALLVVVVVVLLVVVAWRPQGRSCGSRARPIMARDRGPAAAAPRSPSGAAAGTSLCPAAPAGMATGHGGAGRGVAGGGLQRLLVGQ